MSTCSVPGKRGALAVVALAVVALAVAALSEIILAAIACPEVACPEVALPIVTQTDDGLDWFTTFRFSDGHGQEKNQRTVRNRVNELKRVSSASKALLGRFWGASGALPRAIAHGKLLRESFPESLHEFFYKIQEFPGEFRYKFTAELPFVQYRMFLYHARLPWGMNAPPSRDNRKG